MALLVISPAAPAGADPALTDPGTDGAGTTVLIVHTDGDTSGTAADARSATIDVRHTFPASDTFSVQVPSSDTAAAVATLQATPGVTAVEPPVTRTFTAVTTDPNLGRELDYLDAVHAPQAWAVTHGSATVRVAVVDTGIDLTHPDLRSKVVGTYNADTGGTSITDDVGHGTFVAGVAAAATNNGVGIAGAGYDTSLLGVKIARPDGELSVDDEIAGINWAVANHADIINLSLGGTDFSAAEQTAVEHAIRSGVLVVAAAGNDADSVKQYPAAYAGVIAVGATDVAHTRRAGFSSFGSWVTLAAPGVGIYSTVPRAGSDLFGPPGDYHSGDGTSFSSPLVAGEAALLKAKDPSLTVAQLTHALVASAGGYSGQGLGAGQVDFAGALTHLPPTITPTAAAVVGTSDRVSLTANTAAPAAEFRVDSGAWSAPATAASGVAMLAYDTWGLANGSHTLQAVSCSVHGECGTTVVSSAFRLTNSAPTLVDPATNSLSSGQFAVHAVHPSGGGARLLVDGHSAGFAAASPYTFAVDASALADGPHTLQTVQCSTTGTLCAGPSSPAQTIRTLSLHPRITGLAHPVISPNGDGVGDAATLSFTLPDDETVSVQTVDAAGHVVRSAALGELPAGPHTWTWQGKNDSGARLADGRYTLALATTAPLPYGETLDGYAATTGVVDTVAPALSRPTGNGAVFYPVRDGYLDTFAPGITLSAPGTLTLTLRNARGTVVRVLTTERPAGAARLAWDGRDAHNRLLAAGTYRWQYSVTDPAGNRSVAANYAVGLSAKRLVTKVAYIRHDGTTYIGHGGTDSCATARHSSSRFTHGVALRNGCRPGTGDFAYAAYRFAVPGALRYTRLALQVYGASVTRPSALSVAVERTDGGLEIPAHIAVRARGNHWHPIASVPAAGHITGAHHAYATVILDGTYRGTNDFDLKYARMRVTYIALR